MKTSLLNANCNSHDFVFQIFRKFSEQRSHVSKNSFKNGLLNSAFSNISGTSTVNDLLLPYEQYIRLYHCSLI